jgi:hypothetical protein
VLLDAFISVARGSGKVARGSGKFDGLLWQCCPEFAQVFARCLWQCCLPSGQIFQMSLAVLPDVSGSVVHSSGNFLPDASAVLPATRAGLANTLVSIARRFGQI